MRLRAEDARSIVMSSGYEDLKHLLLLIHRCAVKGMLSYTFNSSDRELDSGLRASLHDLGYTVSTFGIITTISW